MADLPTGDEERAREAITQTELEQTAEHATTVPDERAEERPADKAPSVPAPLAAAASTMSDEPHTTTRPPSTPPPDLASELAAVRAERDAFLAATEETAGELTRMQGALAELQKQHAFVCAAKEAVETQLQAERAKREAADESVELLRSRLDDARKAVTGLQGDQRRRTMTLGYGPAPAVGDGGGSELLADPSSGQGQATDTRSKRASVLGMQSLKAHRRVSSQSEPGYDTVSFGTTTAASPSAYAGPALPTPSGRSTKPGGLRELRLGVPPATPGTPDNRPPLSPEMASEDRLGAPTPSEGGVAGLSKRWSTMGIFRNATLPASSESADEPSAAATTSLLAPGPSTGPSPRPPLDNRASSDSLQERLLAAITHQSPDHAATAGKSEATRAMEVQIAALQAQLAESQEARLASEHAVKILREFLSANTPDATPGGGGGGDGSEPGVHSPMQGLRLPPLPTDSAADDEDERYTARQANTRKVSGWTLRLWKDAPAAAPAAPSSANSSAHGLLQESPRILGSASVQGPPNTPGGAETEGSAAGLPGGQPPTPSPAADSASSRLLSFFGKTRSPQQAETAAMPSAAVVPRREDEESRGAHVPAEDDETVDLTDDVRADGPQGWIEGALPGEADAKAA